MSCKKRRFSWVFRRVRSIDIQRWTPDLTSSHGELDFQSEIGYKTVRTGYRIRNTGIMDGVVSFLQKLYFYFFVDNKFKTLYGHILVSDKGGAPYLIFPKLYCNHSETECVYARCRQKFWKIRWEIITSNCALIDSVTGGPGKPPGPVTTPKGGVRDPRET